MTPAAEIPALTIEPADPVGAIARELIQALCSEMSERYGVPPSPFTPSEAAAPRSVFLVARLNGQPIGCGALREFDDVTAETKRMYVAPAGRRKGIARQILVELERHAQSFNYRTIRLETGILQPEAQRLYESLGYRLRAAFGPYVGNPTSVCYEKTVSDSIYAVILPYSDAVHRLKVIALWDAVFGYKAAHNQPALAIDKKLENNDGLFFVALSTGTVIGTVMAGYDGHRGWIYSVAVSPTHRHRGIGSQLVRFAEEVLASKGCVKVNLQIMAGNESVVAFYAALGFSMEERISMGKRIGAKLATS